MGAVTCVVLAISSGATTSGPGGGESLPLLLARPVEVDWSCRSATFATAAYNLIRLPKLLEAAP